MSKNEKVGALLQAMPLDSIFTSVLSAVSNSQSQLAATTTSFINDTCLTKEVQYATDGVTPLKDGDGKVITKANVTNVDFSYSDGDGTKILSVPLMSVVNVPALSISEVDINFSVEINAMEANSSSNSSVNTSEAATKFNADASYGFGAFKMKVHVEGEYKTSCTVKNKSNSSDSLSTKACLDVRIKAVDKQPEGLKTILRILNDTIQSKAIKSDDTQPV